MAHTSAKSVFGFEGVDLIDCSSSFNSPDAKNYPFGAGWQVPFSEKIRQQVGIATAAVESITQAMQAGTRLFLMVALTSYC